MSTRRYGLIELGLCVAALFGVQVLSGCDSGPASDVEEAVEEVGDEATDAASDIVDEVDDATD